MKKILTGIVSIMASLALMTSPFMTFADEGDGDTDGTGGTTSTTLNNYSTANLVLTNANPNDKFNLYRIMLVEYNETTNTLEYKWNSSKYAEVIKELMPGDDDISVEEFIALDTETRRDVLARLHQKIIESPELTLYSKYPSGATADDKGVVKFEDVEMGGYLIAAFDTTDVYQFIFKSVEPTVDKTTGKYVLDKTDFNIKTKHNPITISKTADKSSYETRETITYTIIADVPQYGNSAIDKWFAVDDNPPESVDIDTTTIQVFAKTDVEGAEWQPMALNDTYTLITPEGYVAGTHVDKFTIDVHNIKNGAQQFDKWYSYTIAENGGDDDMQHQANYKKIKITYEAKLNDKAHLASYDRSNPEGVQSNLNTANITFYPYPYRINTDTDEIDKAVKSSRARVYTYGAEIFKYDENTKDALAGAKFKLYSDADFTGENNDELVDVKENTLMTGYYYRYSEDDDAENEAGKWKLADEDTVLETQNNGMIYIKGLKGNWKYYLKEISAPTEYNLPEKPIVVLETVLEKDSHMLYDTHAETSKGYVYASIANKKGFTLPSTGGTGVLILKIAGIIAMAAAVIVVCVVLFMPKKKKNR